jgi:hypothetical protein
VGKPIGAVGLRTGGGFVIAVEDGFALLDPDWDMPSRSRSSSTL